MSDTEGGAIPATKKLRFASADISEERAPGETLIATKIADNLDSAAEIMVNAPTGNLIQNVINDQDSRQDWQIAETSLLRNEDTELNSSNESLDSLSVEELKRKQEEIDRLLAERQKEEKAAVIRQILDVASTYHVTIEELIDAFGGFKPKRKGVKAQAKYRDPVTGITWSGRGKEPTWMRGQDRNKFLIKD